MKVHVDMKKCICSGMCVTIAPLLFELDDKNQLVVIKKGKLNAEEIQQAENSIACCPVEAIELVESKLFG